MNILRGKNEKKSETTRIYRKNYVWQRKEKDKRNEWKRKSLKRAVKVSAQKFFLTNFPGGFVGEVVI